MVGSLAEFTALLDPTGERMARIRPGRGISRAPVPLVGDENAPKRAVAYLASMPGAIAGQNGHNALYAAAAALVHGFALPEADALALLLAHYNPRCVPEWHPNDVERKVREAATKAHREQRGYLLARGGSGVSVDLVELPAGFRLGGALPAASVGHHPTPDDLAKLNEADDDPHRIAREILRHYVRDGSPTIRFFRENFYEWQADKGYWRLIEDHALDIHTVTNACRAWFVALQRVAMEKFAAGVIDKMPVCGKVTGLLRSNVLAALRSEARVSRDEAQEAPAWINGVTGPSPLVLVAARNGLVNLAEYAEGNCDAIRPATPDFFNLHAVDFEVSMTPGKPTHWLAFLDSLWPDDPQAIALLQEWMGYLLTVDNSKQAALMLMGPPRCGKGTITRTIQKLIGSANCCASDLDSLGESFGLADLYGKSLCLIEDAQFGKKSDPAKISRIIRNITGGDAVTINQKNVKAFSATLGTRLIMSANEVVPLPDPSGAIATRWRVLQFTKSFAGREDRGLGDRLMSELPAIFAWAVEGWDRARKAHEFTRPESSEEAFDSIREAASPVLTFVSECIVMGAGLTATPDDLYAEWCAFCVREGTKDPGNSRSFGRKLAAALPGIGRKYIKDDKRRSVRVYDGISIATRGYSHEQTDVPGVAEICPRLGDDVHVMSTSLPADNVDKPNDVIYL